MGVVVAVVLYSMFMIFIGRSWESYHNVKFLNDGRKFVSIRDGIRNYVLGEQLYGIEKIPTGFYRKEE